MILAFRFVMILLLGFFLLAFLLLLGFFFLRVFACGLCSFVFILFLLLLQPQLVLPLRKARILHAQGTWTYVFLRMHGSKTACVDAKHVQRSFSSRDFFCMLESSCSKCSTETSCVSWLSIRLPWKPHQSWTFHFDYINLCQYLYYIRMVNAYQESCLWTAWCWWSCTGGLCAFIVFRSIRWICPWLEDQIWRKQMVSIK